ncbi:aspartate aminotransferase family protein [Saccharothrix hoggarensis]|uniref:Aspartate aminotransferase family protein n=1 Tax=Saccharothrix hoggarensis TaxID=913853 RepID=A0ABW3QIQ9_9PSEU
MAAPTMEPELAEAHMRGLLAGLGLDVEYVRGEGDTLYYRDRDGTETAVLDLVGGYGTLIFGHNHPDLVALARDLLAKRVPLHAQFSYHPYANELAAALNRVLHREFGIDEPYSAVFANSGAEGIETAMKHAELDRVIRVGELHAAVEADIAAARAAVADGTATVSAEARARLGVTDGVDFDAVVSEIARHNAEVLGRGPVFLTLEGSFHGKLAGSVQLTHNAGYRAPFRALAAQARFVPVDQPGALASVLAEERVALLAPVVVDGQVTLAERDFPAIGAFFVEPVQGEGGIHVLSPELAAEIRAAADSAGFPVVVDEVQSGMGRTGRFFSASGIGLLGDYFVLAKGLGGGIAKTAALLVRQSRYRSDFELVHSSTFAKDALSCHIGIKVVEMLEADDGAAYRLAVERGGRLRRELDAVAAEFPDVVAAVRGRGLMLGIEFHDLTGSTSEVLRDNARAGLIGYLVAGYLLREQSIRVFPTASAAHTLRVEPSLAISDEAIEQFGRALRALCAIIGKADGMALLPN